MGQRGADEKVLVEDSTVLDLVFKVHQYRILDELGLKKTLFVDGTVEKALVAEIPEEVHGVVAHEKVFGERASEVSDLVSEEIHGLVGGMVVDYSAQLSMEE